MLKYLKTSFYLALITVSSYAMAQPEDIAISSCADLQNIVDMQAHYYLTQNINCEHEGIHSFKPLPFVSGAAPQFTGTLDGRGYAIMNMHIRNDENEQQKYTGIFREIADSQFMNLTVYDATVTARDEADRGFFAGRAYGTNTFSNINVYDLEILRSDTDHAPQKDHGASGGLVGLARSTATFTDVHVDNANIMQNAFAGGIVGIAEEHVIIDQSSVTRMSTQGGKTCTNGDSQCGLGGLIGLVGAFPLSPEEGASSQRQVYDVEIKRSFSTGSLHSEKNFGGLVGLVKADRSLLIQNSYSKMRLYCESVERLCKYAGGLIGQGKEERNAEPIYLDNVYVAGLVDINGDRQGRAVIGHSSKDGTSRVKLLGNGQSYFDNQATDKKYSGDKISKSLSSNTMKACPQAPYFQGWDAGIWSFVCGYYPSLLQVIHE